MDLFTIKQLLWLIAIILSVGLYFVRKELIGIKMLLIGLIGSPSKKNPSKTIFENIETLQTDNAEIYRTLTEKQVQ